VSPSQACKTLVFCDFSADEGPKDGGPISRQPRNGMHKACRLIAVVAAAIGTSEGRVEHACLDEVLADGTATTALGLQTTTMHRAIGHAAKLVNHAVIPTGHATWTEAQLGTPPAAQ